TAGQFDRRSLAVSVDGSAPVTLKEFEPGVHIGTVDIPTTGTHSLRVETADGEPVEMQVYINDYSPTTGRVVNQTSEILINETQGTLLESLDGLSSTSRDGWVLAPTAWPWLIAA